MKSSFTVFEGVDHCGKSLQIELLKKYLKSTNEDKNVIYTREPGGYNLPVCERIREILLDPLNEICKETEAYLYAASRAQHVNYISKELQKGSAVICDRFYQSSLVYQGIVRGLGHDNIKELNHMALRGLEPDLMFYLKIDIETYKERKQKQELLDRLESENIEFFEKVLNGYDAIFSDTHLISKGKLIILDGRKTPEEIHEEITYHIKRI